MLNPAIKKMSTFINDDFFIIILTSIIHYQDDHSTIAGYDITGV